MWLLVIGVGSLFIHIVSEALGTNNWIVFRNALDLLYFLGT